MKFMKQIKINVTFFFLGIGGLFAQETVPATGGDAIGTGGKCSYTVGQAVYTVNLGANGSVVQGVQQPYEISTTIGLNETSVNLKLSVYPNPTTNYLTLSVTDNVGLNYQLCDPQGRIIESKVIRNSTTNISLETPSVAIYFLTILKNNQVIKIFKVIKIQ